MRRLVKRMKNPIEKFLNLGDFPFLYIMCAFCHIFCLFGWRVTQTIHIIVIYLCLFIIRNDEAQDEMTLDLHDLGAKDALRLLKRHLLSFSGIPCKSVFSQLYFSIKLFTVIEIIGISLSFPSAFKSLKVILETKDEDATKGSRRRMVRMADFFILVDFSWIILLQLTTIYG